MKENRVRIVRWGGKKSREDENQLSRSSRYNSFPQKEKEEDALESTKQTRERMARNLTNAFDTAQCKSKGSIIKFCLSSPLSKSVPMHPETRRKNDWLCWVSSGEFHEVSPPEDEHHNGDRRKIKSCEVRWRRTRRSLDRSELMWSEKKIIS